MQADCPDPDCAIDAETFRATFEQAAVGMAHVEPDGRFRRVNSRLCEILGYPREKLLQLRFQDITHEEDLAADVSLSRRLQSGEIPHYRIEKRYRRHDGTPLWVALTVSLARRADGTPDCLVKVVEDIDARRHAEEERRRLDLLDRGSAIVLEALVRGDPLPTVLTELIRLVESLLPEAIGSVLLLDRDGIHLRTGAAPGLPADFNTAIDGAAIGPAEGSCGTAAYQRRRVVVEDIETSPLWTGYRDLARLGDVRACWSEPVLADGRVLGTFALYYRTPRAPTAPQLAALERAAHFAALAISRHHLEEDLRHALARRQFLFEQVPVGLALCRMDGRLVEVNPAYAGMLGRSIADTLQLTYWQLTPERYAEAEEEQLRQLGATGRYGPYEKEYRHADGHLVPVRLVGRVLTVDGETMILSAAEDLSAQRSAEAARNLMAERITTMIERMSDGFVMLDRDWNYVYVNRRAGELLGRPPDELVGRNIWKLFPEGVGQPFHKAYEKAMAERATIVLEEHYAPWNRWFENRIHGDADGLSIYFQDITERKTAEHALRAANERLQALSARVLSAQETERRRISRDLHDQIGQTLTALKITVQSAGAMEASEVLRRRLKHCVEIADAAIGEVRALSLDLRPPQLDDLGLAAALRWTLDRQAGLAGFTAAFEDAGIPEHLDESVAITAYRIAQEAITNAVRHAHPSAVAVRVRIEGDRLVVEIEDDGHGFDPARALRNLGLNGMEERAVLVGGRLAIESGNERGTLVRAVLPLRPAAQGDPA